MVGTKWSHGNIRSNSQNLQDPLRSLVGQEPEDDILLSRDIINDLRIGPNLDYTNFGNPTENEIQRIINVDWRDEGNPDDFQTNRILEKNGRPINRLRITTITIETQGDPFENRPEIETLDIEFPLNMTYTQIGSNVSSLKHLMKDGTNLTMFFNSCNITLTFPSVNGQPFITNQYWWWNNK